MKWPLRRCPGARPARAVAGRATKRAATLAFQTATLLAAATSAPTAGAQSPGGGPPEAGAEAPTVVVTGSLGERRWLDTPYAVGVVDAEALRQGGPRVNLSEALARVPGLVVANRQNLAQDLQISSRGFGARAGFGVRGLRLLADGIPASGPDGQGQVAHFDLAAAERIEVLRGPFSVLYGNSSGGVVSLVTAVPQRRVVEGELALGGFGLHQLRASAALPLEGGWHLRLGASQLASTGPRPHSAAQRELGTAQLGWAGGPDRVTLQASALEQPALDPLGLSRAQFEADPGQTTAVATQYNTRKLASQQQWGGQWLRRFADDGAWREWRLAAFQGQRRVTQWLAIAPATQANPQHGGGVADFDRRYRGLDARGLWALGPLQVHAGVALEQQTDDRRGHENFSGSGTTAALGVLGALRRAETNHASTRDAYAQAEWALGTDWLASAGLRSGQVRLRTQDQFLANGDDSGERRWRYTNPVLGLRWLAAPGWAWHASLGRGFESPTLGELAYRADGSGGFNSRLQAQTSRQWELGSKWRGAAAAGLPGPLEAEFTLFQARTDQEIGVATNSGGRSAFQNVGRTLRQGAELAAAWAPANGWNGRLALTWLDATYRDSFLTCAALPCTTPTAPVAAGARVAGTQRGSAWAEGGWRGASPWGRWHTAVEWRGVGRTAVNDRNSDFADAWHTTGLRAGATWATAGGGSLEALLRWENIFNRRYSGSVIVNDANGRFFEPGAPRHTQLVLRWVPPA